MTPEMILRFSALRSSRWRNGGGTTRELARGDGRGEDFLWRLSLAEIDEPGAFSLFPGSERIFTVVAGGRITLTVQGRDTTVLQGRPFAFPGSVPVTARLPAGPVRALNVIFRPDAVQARMTVVDLVHGRARKVPAGSFAVLLSGSAVVHAGADEARLQPYDTVRGAADPPSITGAGSLALVSFMPGTAVGAAPEKPAETTRDHSLLRP